ncbi:hypothetical protein BD289DRAFT_261078 [Coniella lustricola]|uniref:Transmembrane protein n=1 Tax=Coniella lustricola TaxID=2025994 RepID=A0A2T3A7Q7_9PEZI|nr:hypothetical protein BD289DRAFT_261078 [Coniella lustricola]
MTPPDRSPRGKKKKKKKKGGEFLEAGYAGGESARKRSAKNDKRREPEREGSRAFLRRASPVCVLFFLSFFFPSCLWSAGWDGGMFRQSSTSSPDFRPSDSTRDKRESYVCIYACMHVYTGTYQNAHRRGRDGFYPLAGYPASGTVPQRHRFNPRLDQAGGSGAWPINVHP